MSTVVLTTEDMRHLCYKYGIIEQNSIISGPITYADSSKFLQLYVELKQTCTDLAEQSFSKNVQPSTKKNSVVHQDFDSVSTFMKRIVDYGLRDNADMVISNK